MISYAESLAQKGGLAYNFEISAGYIFRYICLLWKKKGDWPV
jgi:hypothetical protein